MSRSIPAMAVIALLAVVAIGTGYAYTAVYTQDLGSAEVKVSFIEVTGVADTISTDGNVFFAFDKKGLDDSPLYMDLTLKVTTPASGYVIAGFGGSNFFAKIENGAAHFVAIPMTVASGMIGITIDGGGSVTGCSVSELVIYSTGGSS